VATGLALGALGGGGSILTVPALVYALNVNAKVATGASLLIVGLSALIGAAAHFHSHHVKWKIGISVGLISILGSLLGTSLNRRIDPSLLLLIFAILMFVVAGAMFLRDQNPLEHVITNSHSESFRPEKEFRTVSDTILYRSMASSQVIETQSRNIRPGMVVAVSVGVGFLTGFLGVGGGFIIVPSFVFALGLDLPEAIGTSLVVIVLSSVFALVERGGVHDLPGQVVAPFAVAAMVFAALGKVLTSRISIHKLNYAFITLVTIVAIYVLIRSLYTLA